MLIPFFISSVSAATLDWSGLKLAELVAPVPAGYVAMESFCLSSKNNPKCLGFETVYDNRQADGGASARFRILFKTSGEYTLELARSFSKAQVVNFQTAEEKSEKGIQVFRLKFHILAKAKKPDPIEINQSSLSLKAPPGTELHLDFDMGTTGKGFSQSFGPFGIRRSP